MGECASVMWTVPRCVVIWVSECTVVALVWKERSEPTVEGWTERLFSFVMIQEFM